MDFTLTAEQIRWRDVARNKSDAVLQARLAAVKDPEGEALANTIAAITRARAPGKLAAE